MRSASYWVMTPEATARPRTRSGCPYGTRGADAAVGSSAGSSAPGRQLHRVERRVALLAAVRSDRIVHRASMFALLAVRRARADGIPASVIAHEDIHILRKPTDP